MTGLNNIAYRLSGGRAAGSVGNAPLGLLTTTGRRSGQPRTVPLLYLLEGGDYAIVASRGGMPRHPAWYLNLRDNPVATFQTGAKVERVIARHATAEERERLWPMLTAAYAHFDAYQSRTPRQIPIMILSPA